MTVSELVETLTPPATEQLASLRTRLETTGLVEFLSSFDPADPSPAKWLKSRPVLPTTLRSLLEFFAFNQPLPPPILDEALGDRWRVLVDVGLARFEGGEQVRMNGYMLAATFGILIFVEPPKHRPKLYYSNDSFALFSRISISRGERALDLCSGSGVQALRLALSADSVDAVEKDPEVARMLSINLALNKASKKVKIHVGSLFEPLDLGAKYDVIVSNPPFVPSLPGQPLLGYAEGGIDGFLVTRSIVQGLSDFMTADGRAHMIGMLLTDDHGALVADECRAIAGSSGLDMKLTLLSHSEISDSSHYFKTIVGMARMATGRSQGELARDLRAVLDGQGASGACTYALFVTRGKGIVEIVDLRHAQSLRPWFA